MFEKNAFRIGVFGFFLFLARAASLEIQPIYYLEMQEKAPEKLQVQILEVEQGERYEMEGGGGVQVIRLQAEVLQVDYSVSQLEKGSIIFVRYQHFTPPEGWVGPRPIPVLEKGETVPAFLRKAGDGDYYLPAAKGYSFEHIPQEMLS